MYNGPAKPEQLSTEIGIGHVQQLHNRDSE